MGLMGRFLEGPIGTSPAYPAANGVAFLSGKMNVGEVSQCLGNSKPRKGLPQQASVAEGGILTDLVAEGPTLA